MTHPASQRRVPLRRALTIQVLAARVLDGFRESAGLLADALAPQPSEPSLRRVPAQARRDRAAPR